MFYRYEHYMSISHIALIVNMVHEEQGLVPGHVIPKTWKMVLDISLLNIQHYKVRIKSKVEQSGERSSSLLYTSV